MDYSSKANSSNVRDFLPPIGAVLRCTHRGTKKYYYNSKKLTIQCTHCKTVFWEFNPIGKCYHFLGRCGDTRRCETMQQKTKIEFRSPRPPLKSYVNVYFTGKIDVSQRKQGLRQESTDLEMIQKYSWESGITSDTNYTILGLLECTHAITY